MLSRNISRMYQNIRPHIYLQEYASTTIFTLYSRHILRRSEKIMVWMVVWIVLQMGCECEYQCEWWCELGVNWVKMIWIIWKVMCWQEWWCEGWCEWNDYGENHGTIHGVNHSVNGSEYSRICLEYTKNILQNMPCAEYSKI